jgi:hypothetical protein
MAALGPLYYLPMFTTFTSAMKGELTWLAWVTSNLPMFTTFTSGMTGERSGCPSPFQPASFYNLHLLDERREL